MYIIVNITDEFAASNRICRTRRIWIHRAKEEFELPEYQMLLKELGVEGEWEE